MQQTPLFGFNELSVAFAISVNLLVSLFVLLRGFRRRPNQLWFLVGLLLFIWGLRDVLMPLTQTPQQAISIIKFAELGVFYIPTAFWMFLSEFYRPVLGITRRSQLSVVFVAGSTLLYAISLMPQYNHYHAFLSGHHYVAQPGITAYIGIVFYQIVSLAGFVYSIKAFRKAPAFMKVQIKLIGLSVIAFTFGEVDFINLFTLHPGSANFGHLGILAGNVLISYAILRHRALDVTVIVKKSLAYSIAMAVLAGAYVGFIRLGEIVIRNQRPDIAANLGITVVAIILIAITFEPLRALVQGIIDKLFFKTRYEYQEAIKQFSRMVVTILDLDLLLHKTALTIQDLLKIQQAVIFIHNPETKKYEIGAFAGADEKKLPHWTYRSDSAFVERLKASSRRVRDLNDDFGSSVVVSLFIEQDLIGFLVLGEKLSGDAYSPTDFDLLSTLADQLAIAIENARLYRAAVTDKLTKVFTGAYFYDRLDEELARSREQGTKLAIVFLDADGFLSLSKERGTGVANQALAMIGAIIRANSHIYDISARIGDDEFGVIMPGSSKDAALFTARLIQKEVARAEIDGEGGLVTVASGIGYTEKGTKTSRRMISDARKAVLAAKSKARAQSSDVIYGTE